MPIEPPDERDEILALVQAFAARKAAAAQLRPSQDYLPAAGKVLGPEEYVHLVDAALDGWLTTGRFNDAFEARLAEVFGVRYALTCNSGSSANLLAISALTSPQFGTQALRPGDEVITAAAGFPTTINPILQNRLTPVLVDSELPTYNPSPAQVAAAIGPKTRAIILAHTLGNPFAAAEMRQLADQHGLWLIEDCCDALGASYRGQSVGSFGHLATASFYPAHHITTGEGGAVMTNDPKLKRSVESFRDWGRDCWCAPGCDNTCKKRFALQHGQLPAGYDHKYVYAHAGYNLKITDMQAAIGLAQLDKLQQFVTRRRENFAYLHQQLEACAEFLILPEATPESAPSWFGFPLTLRHPARERTHLLRTLEDQKIGSRLLFAGNVTRQPYFAEVAYRTAGPLTQADRIMHSTFWLGVWPGLGQPHLDYMADRIKAYFNDHP